MSTTLLSTLRELKLVTGKGKEKTLLQLCDAGRLVGGMSFSLRVTPDEAIGPLALALGVRVKVLDVREAPLRLLVSLGGKEQWLTASDLPQLVDALNEALRAQAGRKVAALLGEHEDMWQLWCLSPEVLGEGLEDGWLWPLNAASLKVILPPQVW